MNNRSLFLCSYFLLSIATLFAATPTTQESFNTAIQDLKSENIDKFKQGCEALPKAFIKVTNPRAEAFNNDITKTLNTIYTFFKGSSFSSFDQTKKITFLENIIALIDSLLGKLKSLTPQAFPPKADLKTRLEDYRTKFLSLGRGEKEIAAKEKDLSADTRAAEEIAARQKQQDLETEIEKLKAAQAETLQANTTLQSRNNELNRQNEQQAQELATQKATLATLTAEKENAEKENLKTQQKLTAAENTNAQLTTTNTELKAEIEKLKKQLKERETRDVANGKESVEQEIGDTQTPPIAKTLDTATTAALDKLMLGKDSFRGLLEISAFRDTSWDVNVWMDSCFAHLKEANLKKMPNYDVFSAYIDLQSKNNLTAQKFTIELKLELLTKTTAFLAAIKTEYPGKKLNQTYKTKLKEARTAINIPSPTKAQTTTIAKLTTATEGL